jgi:hypothetical protein
MQGRGGDPALRAALGAKSSAVFYVSSDTLMSPPLRPNGPLLSLAICPFFHGIRKDSLVATRATISPTNGVSQSTIQSCLPVRFLDLVLKFAPLLVSIVSDVDCGNLWVFIYPSHIGFRRGNVFSSSDAKVAHLVGCYFLGIWILTNFGL